MIGVTGIGVYLPQSRMDASQIAVASGLPEWVVREKLGILQKPVPGGDDHPTQMGVWAAERALEQAGVAASGVDVVISMTEEYKEYPVWTAGIKLAHDLGARSAYSFDVGQKCGTGVMALKLARDMLRADPEIDTVLVAGGYRNGDLIDYSDPNVRFMYNLGAGGAAAVVQRDSPRNEVLEAAIRTDGSFSLDVLVPVGGTREPVTADNASRFRLQVPDPQGMKERLETVDACLGQAVALLEADATRSERIAHRLRAGGTALRAQVDARFEAEGQEKPVCAARLVLLVYP